MAKDYDQIWQEVTKTINPYCNESGKLSSKKKTAEKIQDSKHVDKKEIPLEKEAIGRIELEIDRKTRRNLAKKKILIEARLDLHGKTEAIAYEMILSFVNMNYQSHKRWLLIITGKGSGVLQKAVPKWLASRPLNTMVSAFDIAEQKDGGSGALYVRLRKQRKT